MANGECSEWNEMERIAAVDATIKNESRFVIIMSRYHGKMRWTTPLTKTYIYIPFKCDAMYNSLCILLAVAALNNEHAHLHCNFYYNNLFFVLNHKQSHYNIWFNEATSPPLLSTSSTCLQFHLVCFACILTTHT